MLGGSGVLPSDLRCDYTEGERSVLWDAMNSTSTLKIHRPDTRSLIEKIKDEIKKRAEAKARRRMLKVPKRLAKR